MSAPSLAPLALAGRLALVFALAIFLGLAFEEVYKREVRESPGGVRTFPLLAACGAMLYLIEPQHALAFVAGLLVVGAWLHACLRAVPPGVDAPTLMIPGSNLVAYLLGPIALTQPPWVVVAVAVAVTVLLGTREWLHGLIKRVPQDEILIASQFLLLVGVILPLVPNEPVVSITPLTPYKVWLAVVAICTLSYAGYLMQKYAPAREATLLPAVLGGLYSSTAATIALAKRQREAAAPRSDLAAGIIAATAVMYLRLGVVVAIFNMHLALALAPALAGLAALAAGMAFYAWRRKLGDAAARNLSVPAANPLQIPTAVIFAAIFVVISIASAWVQSSFGVSGQFVLALVVGVTDIDPFVINIAQGGVEGVAVQSLAAAILIAASANNLAKAAYAAGFGGPRAARFPAGVLVLLAALGFLVAAVYALRLLGV